ncbi:MAG: hypothetical protein ACRDOH_05645 [Streptosporangiaceae bacterium]
MSTTIPQGTAGAAYESQLAGRAGELLPDLNLTERLELLGVTDPDEMSASLAWLARACPQVFDFAIVRDRGPAGRLTARLAEDEDDGLGGEEPYCRQCGSGVGIFYGHGDGWCHWRGEGTADSLVELFGAGHAPEVAWRPAGTRWAARSGPPPRCGPSPRSAPCTRRCTPATAAASWPRAASGCRRGVPVLLRWPRPRQLPARPPPYASHSGLPARTCTTVPRRTGVSDRSHRSTMSRVTTHAVVSCEASSRRQGGGARLHVAVRSRRRAAHVFRPITRARSPSAGSGASYGVGARSAKPIATRSRSRAFSLVRV